VITVHTDGGCKKPGGVGAWAYTIDWPDGRYIEASGTEASTTNNRMEMMAVLMALKALPDQEAVIFSDSRYVVNGMTDWIYGWHASNWMTFAGEPVKNRDLWQEMIRHCNLRLVSFRHVKGHNGNAGNEHCDLLCTAAMNAYLAEAAQ
jgi:ribonuclease HI